MLHDPYHAAVHAIAALRRLAERDDGALLGALGIAAEPLPHQIATVRRILTATEIRHLIADGVGLGKTVQALMIVNALRLADPRHRTLIVAPQHLLSQWDEELRTRAHVEPVWSDRGDGDGRRRGPVELISPALLLASGLLGLDPRAEDRRHDLLILDEPQSYTVEQRRALANAVPFSQLLLLSATPGLGDRRTREQIFRLIEPERTEIDERSGTEPGWTIAADERSAMEAVEAGALSAGEAFERYAAVRRICRWSRFDWPQIAAPRRYERIDVPMHGRESLLAGRAAAEAGRYESDGSGDPLARAQTLHRIDAPARSSLDRAVIEDEVRGDSRFDALVDRLAELWALEPAARAVIVAGDNPTIDRLSLRLPHFFDDPETGAPLEIASFSRDPNATADEAIAAARERLDPFIRGRARLLLIGQWAQAGLNLQHAARRIIFYSCPWSPRDVDQLIGRLDRLRKGAERRLRAKQKAEGVDIAVVTWRGSPEARVIDGMERLGVFEAPVPPTSIEAEDEIRLQLARLGAGGGGEQALSALAAHRVEDLDTAALSLIADYNPHRTDAAWGIYEALAARSTEPGALHTQDDGDGLRGPAEEQMWSWLASLHATRFLDCEFGRKCKNDPSVRATTAWYADFGTKVIQPPVRLGPFDRTTLNRLSRSDGMQAFNIRRRHMPQPPASRFHALGNPRPLGFFDHGDALHDEFCRAFLEWGRQNREGGSQFVVVAFPPGSNAAQPTGPILLSAYEVGLAPLSIDAPAGDVRPELLRRHAAGIRADDRFVRLARPRRAVVVASRFDGGRWTPVGDDALTKLVDPRDILGGAKAAHAKRGSPAFLPRIAAAGLAEEKRRHDAVADDRAAKQVSVASRIKRIEVDVDRVCRAVAAEAAAVRGRARDDELQRRMIEAQADGIERQIEQVRKLAEDRCAALRQRAREPASIASVVRLLFQPVYSAHTEQ